MRFDKVIVSSGQRCCVCTTLTQPGTLCLEAIEDEIVFHAHEGCPQMQEMLVEYSEDGELDHITKPLSLRSMEFIRQTDKIVARRLEWYKNGEDRSWRPRKKGPKVF